MSLLSFPKFGAQVSGHGVAAQQSRTGTRPDGARLLGLTTSDLLWH